MRTFTFLIFFISLTAVCWSAHAQSNDRCGFGVTGNPGFENWLASKSFNASGNPSFYRIPVVVHVLHRGEDIGEGSNHSLERVQDQIRTLNEDFRRKEDTPGFNTHPDGADTQIEFFLAKLDPEGRPTNGIVRVNMDSVTIEPAPGDIILFGSRYSYWDADYYLNIWSIPMDLPPSIFLGSARFPVTDLPGNFPNDTKKENGDGVFVNAMNFGHGELDEDPHYSQGRTLTHEIGHFLGLLHTYSTCDPGDYCADTPPSTTGTHGCPDVPLTACDGRRVMVENYMDVSYDRCMNIFTNDQTARMHTVLNNSPRRKTLINSPALPNPVTDIPDDEESIDVYPNPASDRLYVTLGSLKTSAEISIHTMLGQTLKSDFVETFGEPVEVSLPAVHEKMIVLVVKSSGRTVRRLIATR